MTGIDRTIFQIYDQFQAVAIDFLQFHVILYLRFQGFSTGFTTDREPFLSELNGKTHVHNFNLVLG
ncbi:MAG: hypothetical protein ACRDBG_16870 [Waterburya sp.]